MIFKRNTAKLSLVLIALLACALFVVACAKKESSEQSTTQKAEQLAADTAATAKIEQPAVAPAALTTTETKTATKTPPASAQPVPAAAEAPMVALDLKLPKPMFIGTPSNLQVPNLEKPLGKPRPPFLAPEGTTNVAFGKSVTSSDDAPVIGEVNLITDGDKEGGDGSYVELGPFLQYVTIDLGKKHNIYAILVWHYHKQPRVYSDVIVQAADDPKFTTNVVTLFNNDHDNSAKMGAGQDKNYVETSEGKLIDAKGVQARYVRLYSNGNSNDDLNHYIEVEVYGKPAATI
jgi:hypothetical protein